MLSASQRCLLGAIMLKFGMALVISWGKINIYFYSYYKQKDSSLSIQYNTLPVAICAIPLCLLSVASLPIARKIGYGNLLKFCGILHCVSLFMAPLMPNYLSFIVFFLVLVATAYALSLYPMLNSVYSHYPKEEGRVSGYLMGSLSMGILVYELMITFICNPNNEEALLEGTTGKTKFHYFGSSVADNVPRALWAVAILSGTFAVIGSWMIDFNHVTEQKDKVTDEKEIDVQTQANVNSDVPKQEEVAQPLPITEKRAILTTEFIIMFVTNLSLYVLVVSISLNYKSFALAKVNDDFFITFVDMISQIIGAVFSLIWGWINDKVPFKIYFAGLLSMSALWVVVLCSTSGKHDFTAFYLLYQIFLKGAILSIAPGMVRIFTRELGTRLMTYLNLAYVLAFLVAPLLQFLLNSLIDFDHLLIVYGSVLIALSPLLLLMASDITQKK